MWTYLFTFPETTLKFSLRNMDFSNENDFFLIEINFDWKDQSSVYIYLLEETSLSKHRTVRTFVFVKKYWNIKYASLKTEGDARSVTLNSEYILPELLLMCYDA